MATSGSTNYASSRSLLISGALRLIGGLAQGETATSDQLTEGAEALNYLCKHLQADGMPLWAIKEYALTLTSGTRSYRIGESATVNTPMPLRIHSMLRRHTSTTTDVPLELLTREQYERISNKTVTGLPLMFWYDPQRTYGDLYVYPVPNATAASDYTYRITYQRPYEDFDAAGDEPDFPSYWFDTLKFGLAIRLAPEYGVPIEDQSNLQKLFMMMKNDALSFGTEEGSLYFQRDTRSGW